MAFTLEAQDQHIRDVSATTEAGRIMAARTTALVSWTNTPDTDVAASAKGMQQILDDTTMGLPHEGDAMDATDLPNLFCTNRTVVIEDVNKAEITYDWKRYNTKINNTSNPHAHDYTIAQVEAGNVQITTERADGGDIIVTHDGTTQVGEISVLSPLETITIEVLLKQVADGSFIQAGWLNKVNQPGVMTGHIGSNIYGVSLCTKVLFRPLSIQEGDQFILEPGGTWIFTFEFVKRSSSNPWNPWVFWRDPETGRPASGMTVESGGKKLVTWYPDRDFSHEPQDEYGI